MNEIEQLVEKARRAQTAFEANGSQALYDRAAKAAAWAIMEPARNRSLAELAVQTTGLGNVPDKITKNHRKTLGLMRDLETAKTFGVVSEDPVHGLTEIARPVGVVGAVVPSTNPGATPANNIINALKCGNAIILSPSPKGVPTCELLLSYVHEQFDRAGIDRDLVQMVPAPGTKEKTQRLLELSDVIVVTGSQNNVKRAYSSGTPALAVGAGNATVIVDETADLTDAAKKIALSKCFDNATSCSSENAVIVVDAVYDAFTAALSEAGGATVADESRIVKALWPDGHLNRSAIAQDAEPMLEALGMTDEVPKGTDFLAVETSGVGPDHPLSGEKLSRVLALYRASDFDAACTLANRILKHQGAGHSVGIHTTNQDRAMTLGMAVPTSRVIVNQAHCIAVGGAFNNGMPFSLSMGCGSWGGNSFAENLNWRQFMQTTKIIREIPPNEPAVADIFADYFSQVGE